MKKLTVSMLALLGAARLALAAEPAMPAAIKVPDGQQLLLRAHARGQQIYTCKPQADGAPQWQLKAPNARLLNGKGKVIGHHSAGPTWKYQDGSEVLGKAAAHVDSPDAKSIPWLLVAATGHTCEGLFAKVAYVQRINTRGGKPAGSCGEQNLNAESSSDYTADYYFYAPAK
jgi:Protein of unknown function (DUF3455)